MSTRTIATAAAMLAQRREYAAAECTLDGVRAKITGAAQPFATVAALDGSLRTVEFSWSAVVHVMTTREGAFRS